MASESNRLLKEHKLRTTECRIDVLDAFLDSGHALSHSDLEQQLETQYDRVTIYRTLNSFMDKGLLHKVPVDDGSTRFAICSEHCDIHGHDDEHIHFKCIVCGQTKCLEDMPVPKLNMPEGYQLTEVNFLVQGVCNKCSGRS